MGSNVANELPYLLITILNPDLRTLYHYQTVAMCKDHIHRIHFLIQLLHFQHALTELLVKHTTLLNCKQQQEYIDYLAMISETVHLSPYEHDSMVQMQRIVELVDVDFVCQVLSDGISDSF